MQKSKKKMCQTDEKKRRGAEVFSTPFFLSIPFPNQNPHQRARAHSIGALLNISFLLFFLRFFVFLSPKRSIHSSRTSRWSRARACIYIYISKRAISSSFTRETRREKEREGKKTTCTRRGSRRKKGRGRRKIESFFRSGRLRESERRREKEREETRLSSSFRTL